MTRGRRAHGFAGVCAALALASAVATAADPTPADAFFKVGARAYKAGRYADAAAAFAEAHALAPTPGLMFSLGQAHRMEYAARRDPARLADAVRWYDAYLAADPRGKRAVEATEHLSRLRPLLGPAAAAVAPTLGASPAPKGAPAPNAAKPPEPSPPPAARPRVMISSPTPGAHLFFDGKEVEEPLIAEVAPGKHTLRIRAPGFAEYARDVEVDAVHGAPPLDVELDPLPARLTLDAPADVELAVDGFVRGRTPLPPLPLDAGRHVVRVTRNGSVPFEETLTLERGEARTLPVRLAPTTQRKAAFAFLGAGGAAAVAAAVLGTWSFVTERNAVALQEDLQGAGDRPPSDLDRYQSLVDRRDRLRLAAGISGGVAGALAGLGTGLLLFDMPASAPFVPSTPEVAPAPTPAAPAMELSVVPVVGPRQWAARLELRF